MKKNCSLTRGDLFAPQTSTSTYGVTPHCHCFWTCQTTYWTQNIEHNIYACITKPYRLEQCHHKQQSYWLFVQASDSLLLFAVNTHCRKRRHQPFGTVNYRCTLSFLRVVSLGKDLFPTKRWKTNKEKKTIRQCTIITIIFSFVTRHDNTVRWSCSSNATVPPIK